jgi:hypothetical protein
MYVFEYAAQRKDTGTRQTYSQRGGPRTSKSAIVGLSFILSRAGCTPVRTGVTRS